VSPEVTSVRKLKVLIPVETEPSVAMRCSLSDVKLCFSLASL
jgi:hypothetical protein